MEHIHQVIHIMFEHLLLYRIVIGVLLVQEMIICDDEVEIINQIIGDMM